jgi:hypothetical protein
MRLSDKNTHRLIALHKRGDTEEFEKLLNEASHAAWRRYIGMVNASDRRKAASLRARKRRAKEEHERELQRIKNRNLEERRRQLEIERQKQKRIHETILRLIKEKKISITHRYMKSVKDPQRKREIVEATCLSKV